MYELSKGYQDMTSTPGAMSALAIGLVVSFVVALLVIAAFLRYLKRFGLMPFGVYRIVLGVVVLALVGAGQKPPAASEVEDSQVVVADGWLV